MQRTVPGIGLLIVGGSGLAACLLSASMMGPGASVGPFAALALLVSLTASAFGTALCLSDRMDEERTRETGGMPPPWHPDRLS